ncbi:MAG: tRNA uridine-5-carboxymethylaminomethyl(34) synthesis GTPase MnmE [Chloroflexi bacterium]|nr:tRNA uridine-5-carboxymethylaminomethyl(34) synthesis GTPase MnmE [Chloroflexota bacterium]
MYNDTIVAISTPVGEGGIGIVRLSGDMVLEIASKLFTGAIAPRKLSHGWVVDRDNGDEVDEVLVSFMPGPHSYTRENVVEINCHGGSLAVQRILGLCLRHGARLAAPGEFTLRAFLNGRIDLAQAEAVQDVIRARTAASLKLAIYGLEGRLSREIKAIRGGLMSSLAAITARIDFPDDEIEEVDLVGQLSRSLKEVELLVENAGSGAVYRQGVRTAIVGRPNVGKSSILNILLGEDRAIVTPIPGTTRDTLEETLNIEGVPFILVDTAGITRTDDPVESLGIERSRKAIEKADLVLIVVDISVPLAGEDHQILGMLDGKEVIVVANKSDLLCRADLSAAAWTVVPTSAVTGAGIAALKAAMVSSALGGKVVVSDALLVSNPRHRDALERACRRLSQALEGLRQTLPDDLVSVDLTGALDALGEITGETVQEDLLNTIFSQFCVGK